jgi:glycosyltransferase involved in cell wall biosynthesis
MGQNDLANIVVPSQTETIDVTIVMPCLNEVRCLPACIANANDALARMQALLGLRGEIIIADNGSTDGSQDLAARLGARVVTVAARGYGAALMGGANAAKGRYIVMGDADGSYDFVDSVAMVGELMAGAELCMGSRFEGGIMPGAMPWKNRYIGNPILTGLLNILFQAGISDAHCGLRALTKACFLRLDLSGTGMEFASEMVIKAALKNCRIAEVPAVLSPDLRDRPPHLRPWRDGWRHLRYLLMLSPYWMFAVPAALLALAALTVFGMSGVAVVTGGWRNSMFGNYWVILAGAMLSVAHMAALLAVASHMYGIREGYRRPAAWTSTMARWVSLETMLITGIGMALAGFAILSVVAAYWSVNSYGVIVNVMPAVAGTTLIAVGMQNALGGFMLAIVAGNEAEFLTGSVRQSQSRMPPSMPWSGVPGGIVATAAHTTAP